MLEYKDEIDKLIETNLNLKKTTKTLEKNNASVKVNEELEEDILSLKLQLSDKTQIIQEMNNLIKAFEAKLQKTETENARIREDLEEYQQKNEDLLFKCERLTSQAKIAETITANLKQAQDDYQRYLKEEKENFENKEKELKEKYEQLDIKLKKKYQNKEYQLKQEVNQSIDDIQKSVEFNDLEHAKTRNENISLKENIKNLNESYGALERSFKDQLEKTEQELQSTKILLNEKASLIEKLESVQKIEKTKFESSLNKEKDLGNQLKLYEDKLKMFESKLAESKKHIDGLSTEIMNLKSELIKESHKTETKQAEIDMLNQREKDYQLKINRLKDEKLEATETLSKDFEEQMESNINIIRIQLTKEYDTKIEEYKNKIQEIISENKSLKKRLEQKSSDMQRLKIQNEKIQTDYKENPKNLETNQDEYVGGDVYSLKQKLSKLHKQKSSIEQKLANVKDECAGLEEKLKQDSAFFRNETLRKDEELGRLKKKFETKLREIYAESSLITEQLRTDLLRLNNEIRNRDAKENCYWISKLIEEMLQRIPSY